MPLLFKAKKVLKTCVFVQVWGLGFLKIYSKFIPFIPWNRNHSLRNPLGMWIFFFFSAVLAKDFWILQHFYEMWCRFFQHVFHVSGSTVCHCFLTHSFKSQAFKRAHRAPWQTKCLFAAKVTAECVSQLSVVSASHPHQERHRWRERPCWDLHWPFSKLDGEAEDVLDCGRERPVGRTSSSVCCGHCQLPEKPCLAQLWWWLSRTHTVCQASGAQAAGNSHGSTHTGQGRAAHVAFYLSSIMKTGFMAPG